MVAEKKLLCVALGGNAIKQAKEKGTAEEQFFNVRKTCEQIVKLIKDGYQIIITHGNGPQVGNLLIQQEEGKDLVPPQPLDVCGAMTQGQIGYMIQNQLQNLLAKEGLNIPVVSVVTQVLVDKEDKAFQDPTKPVGPFYTEEEAKKLEKEKGYIVKKVKDEEKGWRRVVPSPEPKDIIEIEAVKALLDSGAIVIASGGGGIPVVKEEELKGVEAVIDKDKAGCVLAQKVKADIFMILTDVDGVYLNYGSPQQERVKEVKLDKMEEYVKTQNFQEGSMGPKVIAALRFVQGGGNKSIITSLDKAHDSLTTSGKEAAGTVIVR